MTLKKGDVKHRGISYEQVCVLV